MQPLQTVVLEHTTDQGIHYDWLIEDPTLPNPKAPDARLWTARATPHPAQWAALKTFSLEVIAPHRRIYLTYEGPLSRGRGSVRRVAQGSCLVHHWDDDRIALNWIPGASPPPAHLSIALKRHAKPTQTPDAASPRPTPCPRTQNDDIAKKQTPLGENKPKTSIWIAEVSRNLSQSEI